MYDNWFKQYLLHFYTRDNTYLNCDNAFSIHIEYKFTYIIMIIRDNSYPTRKMSVKGIQCWSQSGCVRNSIHYCVGHIQGVSEIAFTVVLVTVRVCQKQHSLTDRSQSGCVSNSFHCCIGHIQGVSKTAFTDVLATIRPCQKSCDQISSNLT